VASCPRIVGFNSFIKFIVGYIEVGLASSPGIGGLNIYIKYIVGYIGVKVASCPRNKRF